MSAAGKRTAGISGDGTGRGASGRIRTPISGTGTTTSAGTGGLGMEWGFSGVLGSTVLDIHLFRYHWLVSSS